VDEAEEVFDVILPSGDEAPEVVHPGEEALDLPAFPIAAQLAAVLGLRSAMAVGRDQLDAVLLVQALVQLVRVVGLVADQPRRELVQEAGGEDFFDQPALRRRSALHRYGEWKTVISGDSEDLRALAPPRGADREAPFLALAKVASTNASSRFSLPCSCSTRASTRSASSSLPDRTHCWNRRWQVWNGGYFSGSSRHCAPVPSTHRTPFNTARVSCHGRPRLSSRRAGRSTGSTTIHCSSANSQRPVIAACGAAQSFSRLHQNTTQNVYETGSSSFVNDGCSLALSLQDAAGDRQQ